MIFGLIVSNQTTPIHYPTRFWYSRRATVDGSERLVNKSRIFGQAERDADCQDEAEVIWRAIN